MSHDNNTTHHNNTTVAELKGSKKGGKKPTKKQDQDQVEELGMGPDDHRSSPDNHSDEKLQRNVKGQPKKGHGKSTDPVTKGRVSDDKDSRSSQSIDSEKDGRVVK